MFILFTAGVLALLYGALIAFTALRQMRRQEISTGAAALLGVIGLLIMFISLFIAFRIPLAFYVLIASLAAMHILTISNDKKMHEEINPKNHIVRLIISLVIIGLALLGMYKL